MTTKVNEISRFLYETKNTLAVSVEELAEEFVNLYPYIFTEDYETPVDCLYDYRGSAEFNDAFNSCLAKYDKSTLVEYRINKYFSTIPPEDREKEEEKLINALPPVYKKVDNRNFQLYSAVTFLEEGSLPPVQGAIIEQNYKKIVDKTKEYIKNRNPQYVAENESMREICGDRYSYKEEIHPQDYSNRRTYTRYEPRRHEVPVEREREKQKEVRGGKDRPKVPNAVMIISLVCLLLILASGIHKNPLITSGAIIELIGAVYMKFSKSPILIVVGILVAIIGLIL